MNSFLGRIQGKLQEARISDVNHELGKVKESLVSESSAVASRVGSLIRSESTRFSQLWGRSHSREDDLEEDQHQQDKISSTNNSLPKSVSLPAIAAVQNNKANSSSSAFSSKYTYKSSVQEQGTPSVPREEEVDNFIRVLEKKVEEGGGGGESKEDELENVDNLVPRRVTQRSAASTREEIRRKLALFGSEEEEEQKPPKQEKEPKAEEEDKKDLEVCFINQAVTEEEDEDEEEEDLGSGSADCQFREDSSEDEDKTSAASVPKDQGEEEERAREALKKRLERLHRELRLNLSDCKDIARSQAEKDRLRRRREDPLAPLVGFAKHEVDRGRLENCSLAKLQVVAEHFHSEIERLGEELVALLVAKDELEIEQDSQLLDVEDLTHSLGR